MRSLRLHRIVGIPALCMILAACSHQASSTTRPAHDDSVHMTLTDAGCVPAKIIIPAGPHTFMVSNLGTSNVTEFELLDGQRIIGEAENLTPGLHGSFSLNLRSGTYHTHCPGGNTHDGIVHVVGRNTNALSPQSALSVAAYRRYLLTQTNLLAERSRHFIAAIDRGDRHEAEALYAETREPYERIEPVAEQFPDLDRALDARVNDVPSAAWSGYHRIEFILWNNHPMAEALPYTKRLRAQVAELQNRVKSIDLEPAQIANGSVSLLDEVSKTKVTGEEERYSHSDLWDFRANVDGAHAAYRALAPLLKAQDPHLAQTIDARFRALDANLNRYYSAENGFVRYTALRKRDIRELTASVDALAEPLSQLAPRIIEKTS